MNILISQISQFDFKIPVRFIFAGILFFYLKSVKSYIHYRIKILNIHFY